MGKQAWERAGAWNPEAEMVLRAGIDTDALEMESQDIFLSRSPTTYIIWGRAGGLWTDTVGEMGPAATDSQELAASAASLR